MKAITSLLLKCYRKSPIITFDVLAIPLAWYFAYWLRFNLKPFPAPGIFYDAISPLLLLMGVQTFFYYYYKVYRGLWRFSSINDVVRIIKAVVTSVLVSIPLLYLLSLLSNVPRSVFPLYTMNIMLFLCGARLLLRIYRDKRHLGEQTQAQNVLIIGAGHAGESLVRELKRTPAYHPVGLLDDNAAKFGMEIHGVRVLGNTGDLADVVATYQVDLVFIAIPSARSITMRRLVDACDEVKVPVRTLPGITALASGLVEVNELRAVNIEDLLGREQVRIEWDKIGHCITGKAVVITGGGGSIGSELCRQVLQLSPKKLLIIDHSEFNLYSIDREMRLKYPNIAIETLLISVTDAVAIDIHFRRFMPHIVFHAAAFKHVPLLESQIRSAVQNNILGTQVVAEASVAVNVEKFILISTDKAVNPTNIMGTSKRVAEIYCQNLNERVETQFITVRFGNVLGSAGSVVPLFKEQLALGGPLTVTHPDIERFFMTIPEAAHLILQAMANGQGGEIFVLDMGEPIKIKYLAEKMIQLAGKIPGKDVEIIYTGLRPGEKLYEELFHASEQLTPTEHEKLFKALFRSLDWSDLTQTIRLINTACSRHNTDELHILIKSLVPEFKSSLDATVV